MMKTKDLSVATALLIQGFLRANEEQRLSEALQAIRRECEDWAGNLSLSGGLDGLALEPDKIDGSLFAPGGAVLSRTPYNLVSAAIALLGEARDLAGSDAMGDFQRRMPVPVVS